MSKKWKVYVDFRYLKFQDKTSISHKSGKIKKIQQEPWIINEYFS